VAQQRQEAHGNRVKGDLVMSQTFIQETVQKDPRDAERTAAARALLQGPVEALGLGPRLRETESLVEAGRHAEAAEGFLEIGRALVDKRHHVSAEVMRERAAGAFKEGGELATAFELYVQVARDEFERGAEAQFTARRAREVAPVGKEWLAEGLMARALWPEHEDEVVPVLARAWEEARETPAEAEWAAALVEVLSVLGRLEEAVDVAEDACERLPLAEGPRLRLELDRLDAAGELGLDMEQAWRALIDWTRGLADETSALVWQRRGVYLTRRGRPEESVEAFREALERWGRVEGGEDQLAESYFAEQLAWELAGRMSWSMDGARSIAAELRGDPRSAAATAQRLVDRGLRELVEGKHMWEAKRCFFLALAIHRRAGNLRGIFEAHDRLARLLLQVGEGSRALAHLVLRGDEKRAGEVAAGAQDWDWSYMGSVLRLGGPSWERAASYAVLAEAGGRMPDDELAAAAPGLIAASKEPSDFAPGPQPAHQARRALAAVACGLPDELLEEGLRILRDEVRRGGWADREAVRALGLVTRLGRSDETAFLFEASLAEDANAVKNESGLLIEQLREDGDLRAQASRAALDGNREALSLLAYAGLEDGEAELRERCSDRVRSYVDAPEKKEVPGERSAELVILLELGVFGRYCEAELRRRLAERLLCFALDPDELEPSRASAVGALTNLADALDAEQAPRIHEGLLTLAVGAYGSSWQSAVSSDHPLSRFQISLGRPGELRAAAIDALCEVVAEHDTGTDGLDQILEPALSTQDPTLIVAVLTGLIRLPDLELAPDFALYLQHPEARVRATALRLLASRDSQILCSTAALGLSTDPSRFVRSTLLGLARDVGDEGDQALDALSDDPDAYIRRAARSARDQRASERRAPAE
jgi:tetratricopeptide (TPR) repeat protein